MGALLPDGARLVDDPWGERVSPPRLARLVRLGRRHPLLRPLLRMAALPLLPGAAYMQVRTRLIDDELCRFVAGGGRQVVILGAGFDARALRLRAMLGNSRVFEIDHPATQQLKRARFGDGPATYVAWDFERDPLSELPARLAAVGHAAALPTLTVWEGVTAYLTEAAVVAAAAAVRAYSAPGSRLSFTYFDRDVIDRPALAERLVAALVRRHGEPFRFGWAPAALAAWWQAHGFRVIADDEMKEAARRLLPPSWARLVTVRSRHVAVAERL
jgi:methyltransferase (TIGR00027 family)